LTERLLECLEPETHVTGQGFFVESVNSS